ncbi:hypothetical protein [Lachnoclostridium sp.]|uniref:hypothetical protein n=1 Tax=Lachnoclostridium sp. TaxID=2028282 RepID=UPI002898B611|nr:hypothetical protein [Lachnoclostridium sp.]
MRKKIAGILILLLAGTGIFRFGMIAGAASQEPGSAGDPLITQSYLEQRLREVSGGNSGQNGFQKVNISKGKSLYLNEGTECIIYSGGATVLGNMGFINATSGTLAKKSSSAKLYHQYISPSNASGMKATANSIIYVKGSYSMD